MSQTTKVARRATSSLRGPTSNNLRYEGLASLAFTAVPSIKCQDKFRAFLLCARYFIMVLCSFLKMKFGYLIHQGEKYSGVASRPDKKTQPACVHRPLHNRFVCKYCRRRHQQMRDTFVLSLCREKKPSRKERALRNVFQDSLVLSAPDYKPFVTVNEKTLLESGVCF